MDLLLTNIGLLATPIGNTAQKGSAQGEILLIPNAEVGITDGKIAYVRKAEKRDLSSAYNVVFTTQESFISLMKLKEKPPVRTARSTIRSNTIDCSGKLVTPGLVDSHTHLVFDGWRQNELKLKLKGKSYLDILKSGGGILNTVEQTRKASKAQLMENGRAHLKEMLKMGVTTCEAKSGYGLDTENELKQLRIIKALDKTQPIDIIPTFMGAHAIPGEYKEKRRAYIKKIIDEMLPAVSKEELAEFCDVFCETTVFTPEESLRILEEAKKLGMIPKIHADEINPIGGAEIAAATGAISAEHLIQTSDNGIREMAEQNVIAVLLPATSFYLDKPYARARDMIKAGVPVAIATDFNPGSSPSLNMQLAMNLACLKYKMTPAEILTAVTLNGAAAINRAKTCGSIEEGKQADMVIWDAPDLEYIFYRFGSNLASAIIKKGLRLKGK